MVKLSIIYILMVCTLLIVGCGAGKKSPPSSQPTQSSQSAQSTSASAPALPNHTTVPGEREFVGTIGKLKVRLFLAKSNQSLTGSYRYEKSDQELKLIGNLHAAPNFKLQESDQKNNVTGKFIGAYVNDDWIEGTWVDGKGKKTLPFTAWVVDSKQTPVLDDTDKISGEYRRVYQGKFDKDVSSLSLWLMKDRRVRISGSSQWLGEIEGQVNVGSVAGFSSLQNDQIFFKNQEDDAEECTFKIKLIKNGLEVTEDSLQCGGFNVNFNGDYKKVGPPSGNE